MAAAIASAALTVGASLAVGQAVFRLTGRAEWSWLSGPVGLALILVATGISASLQARGTAIAIAIGTLLIVSATILALRRRHAPSGPLQTTAPALGAAFLAALFAALPFIAAGFVGILGVGLVNDDMASHLLIADWIDERFRPEPVFIDQGYPLGPHALVAGLSTLLHASSIDVFAGLMLAIPALTALVAYSALGGLERAPRVAASTLVALPYMAAAYLAQEAFKEPIIALFLLAFALLLPTVKSPRHAIPLGVLAAGTVYVYSFPGLAWLGGVATIWIVLQFVGGEVSLRPTRAALPAVGFAVLTLVVLAAPELPRLLEFRDFRALDPSRANEAGLGNLPGQISPLTGLGIWPTSEFRLSAGANSLPTVVFYAGALLAAAAFVLALPRWTRRHGAAIPAALLAAVALYVAARALGTVYTSAKAISIAAPLVALVTMGGLFAAKRTVLTILATAFAIAAAASSFLILRQAPVAPEAHMQELAEIRPLVQGEKLLFLGRDNFVLYELRGSKPFTSVKNFYDPYFVEPNTELADVFSKFDFDSVTAETLARFPYVLATRAAYASGPPPGYEVVKRTDSYELWQQNESPLGREPGEANADPGRVGACSDEGLAEVSAFAEPPVVAAPAKWSAQTIAGGDGGATIELDLPAGEWEISIQYDSTRDLAISGPGLTETLPGNLDYRGPAPFFEVGEIESDGEQPAMLAAAVEDVSRVGRLLGASSVAHLGAVAATAAKPRTSDCNDYVDWYKSP